MSKEFFCLEKVTGFQLDIMLEDYLKFEDENNIYANIEKISLKDFTLASFGTFRRFYRSITETVPYMSFGEDLETERDYDTRIDINPNKIRFNMVFPEERYTISSDPKIEENGNRLQLKESDLLNYNVDYNYLLGRIIGNEYVENNNFEFKGRLSCKCDISFYEKVFSDITNLTKNIIPRNNYMINGLYFQYNKIFEDDINYTLKNRIVEINENETYRVEFEFKNNLPININNIINNVLNEMNEINNIVEVV